MKWEKGRPKTGGRVPGVPNRATRDIKAIAKGLIEDPGYQGSLKARLLNGSSPTLEVLLHYYAYGKPKTEIVAHAGIQVLVQRETAQPTQIPITPANALPDYSTTGDGRHG